MQKRAQITIFIIISILLLALTFLIYSLSSHLTQKQLARETEETRQFLEISPRINFFVTSCLKNTAEQALLTLGQQGGYYYLEEPFTPYTVLNFSKIPLYYYQNSDLSPEKETIQSELSTYIDLNLDSCLKNFSAFPYYQIQAETPFTTASIVDHKVIFNLHYPLTINNQIELSRFQTEIPSRLNQILHTTKKLLSQTSKEKGLCLTCFIREGHQNKLNFEIISLHHDFIIKTHDQEIPLNNQPYPFHYAYRFD